MSDFLNVNEIKEKVSLLTLLGNLGFMPQKVSGNEHFFLSMLREEYTASLCVNEKLGVWFDHGGAGVSGIKSGSVIDFGLAYWYPATFHEVLHKIVEHANVAIDNSRDFKGQVPLRNHTSREASYEINLVSELIAHNGLKSYLLSRGVDKVAAGFLYQIDYMVLDNKNKQRDFSASGWPNENGGWEVRNKYFKGCLGHKGMSYFPGSAYKLAVFEGCYDFLSWKIENRNDPASVLVLNSLSFLSSAIARAKQFACSEIYFDNDKAGIAGAKAFTTEVSGSIDCSFKYDAFKDYNEKIVFSIKSSKIALDKPVSLNLGNGLER
ncbi:toprim domain-containing protein [Pedobacter agri]|uniref:Toprim domain-containing protein n=1 Tax=Pedobacter agri TaxID=454586 RepID=A0A9X3DDF1_9SPHI|nr:toprim domain-containing protein [Pedobacter agri]MCX3265639.1 toprim domain-containing protein [Pedobacter agri]